MKKKLFDFHLYLESVKRLRIVGLALAILCIAITILIPIHQWIIMRDVVDFKINHLDDNSLAVPALVASYLMPVLAFVLFSYLYKRNESDFYHAIPHTRTCGYVSSIAALMTWIWGILIVACLSAGAFWAINPYTTFSFGGLMLQMLYMCLNAALLVSIAAVAASLMGTPATSLVAFGLLLFSWRFILYIAMICFEDSNNLILGEAVLGGYLQPSYFLPIGLITGEANIERPSVLIYAAVVTLVMFVLGGVAYKLRRSETAGRSVPGRWLQNTVRCLICLPCALMLTYQVCSGYVDVATSLVFLVITLLLFYLYELLTTKSVWSMFKATPWLAAVLGACILFGGAVMLADHVVMNENISEERIAAVGINEMFYDSEIGISSYESEIIGEHMTKNDEAAAIVAKSYAAAQLAERQGKFYSADSVLAETNEASVSTYLHVWMRMRLVSGMTITRRVLIEQKDYARLLEIIRGELDVMPIPPCQNVREARIELLDCNTMIELSENMTDELLQTMVSEWIMLDSEQKKDFLSQDHDKSELPLPVWFHVKIDGTNRWMGCIYYVYFDDMPRTYGILLDAIVQMQPVREQAQMTLENAKIAEEGVMSVIVQAGDQMANYLYYPSKDFRAVTQFLLDHLDAMATVGNATDATLVYIMFDGPGYMTEDDGMTSAYMYTEFTLALRLSEAERTELLYLISDMNRSPSQ